MTTTQSAAPAAPATPAAEAPKEKKLANIVRGVMPVALVAAIKFDEKGIEKDADVAKIYGTTSGKVSDIRKGRNFGYLTDGFKPTAEQRDAAVKWMEQVPGKGEAQDKVIARLKNAKLATAEEAQAFLNTRASSRARTPKAATPASAPAATAPTTPVDPKAAKSLTK